MLANISNWISPQSSVADITKTLTPETVTSNPKESKHKLLVKKFDEHAKLPVKGSLSAAGFDISSNEDKVIKAQDQAIIGTGIGFTVPVGTYGRIAPRSGLAAKHKINVHAGVIDADYQAEVKIILYNHSTQDFKVNKGDRIAQLILERNIDDCEVLHVEDLINTTNSKREMNGFGSTGMNTLMTSDSIDKVNSTLTNISLEETDSSQYETNSEAFLKFKKIHSGKNFSTRLIPYNSECFDLANNPHVFIHSTRLTCTEPCPNQAVVTYAL